MKKSINVKKYLNAFDRVLLELGTLTLEEVKKGKGRAYGWRVNEFA